MRPCTHMRSGMHAEHTQSPALYALSHPVCALSPLMLHRRFALFAKKDGAMQFINQAKHQVGHVRSDDTYTHDMLSSTALTRRGYRGSVLRS